MVSLEEYEYAAFMEDDLIDQNQLPTTIECKKAFGMFWANQRDLHYCENCQPLTMPAINLFQRCDCTFYDIFVGKCWLCLPCFFIEETKVHQDRQEKIVGYSSILSETCGPRQGYLKSELCGCGKEAMEKSTNFCRFCRKATGWYRDVEANILNKILAQLG